MSSLLKDSKRSYCTNYFQNNLNDIISIWKSKKKLIFLKESPTIAPSTIVDIGRNVTKPQEIANAFDKYFVDVANGIQPSNLDDFFPRIDVNPFYF